MQNALTFIVKTLLDLYILTFILRFIMQWVRADFRNPISQFFVRVTNPLIVPARRLIPSMGRLDTATIVVVLLLELVITIILVNLTCINEHPNFIQIIGLMLLRLVYTTLRLYLFVIIVYVLMTWISPGTYNPAMYLLSSIATPVLRPFRRLIPVIAGIDLSPLFALIAIQALTMLLPIGPVVAGLGCLSINQLL